MLFSLQKVAWFLQKWKVKNSHFEFCRETSLMYSKLVHHKSIFFYFKNTCKNIKCHCHQTNFFGEGNIKKNGLKKFMSFKSNNTPSIFLFPHVFWFELDYFSSKYYGYHNNYLNCYVCRLHNIRCSYIVMLRCYNRRYI